MKDMGSIKDTKIEKKDSKQGRKIYFLSGVRFSLLHAVNSVDITSYQAL
jgi:hypothetical protein